VRLKLTVLAVAAAGALAPSATAVNPQIAGLQVALRAHGIYAGVIDGVAGRRTAAGVRAFQRGAGLPVTGVADVNTRGALGPLGTPLFGSRTIRRGSFGWDVSVLEYLLAKRGLYTGALDGYAGPKVLVALRRYQWTMKLANDGVAGPHTLTTLAVRDRVPVRAKPVATARVYVVRAGDSLTAIATRFGTTIGALARANKLDAAKPIVIGGKLVVPVTAAAATGRPAAPASTETLATTSSSVRATLDAWSTNLGVDVHLVRALAWMESGYQTRLVSSAGARGVLQTLPATREYVETVLIGGVAPRTVDGDVQVGVLYLRHLLSRFRGRERLALAAWYQGERAVRKHGVFAVTKPFVANVLALKSRM